MPVQPNESGVTTVNEYQMHDLLCELNPCTDTGCFDHFKLVLKDPTRIPEGVTAEEFVATWEQRVNDLYDLINKTDNEWHEQMERTC